MSDGEKHWSQLKDHDLFPWLVHGERLRGWYLLARVRSFAGGMNLSAGGRVTWVLPIKDADGDPAVVIGATAGAFPSAPSGDWDENREMTPLDEAVSLSITRQALRDATFEETELGVAWLVSVDDVCSVAFSRELLTDKDA